MKTEQKSSVGIGNKKMLKFDETADKYLKVMAEAEFIICNTFSKIEFQKMMKSGFIIYWKASNPYIKLNVLLFWLPLLENI